MHSILLRGLIFLAEVHITGNAGKGALFQQLYENNGVRKLILERGKAQVYLMTKYIKTGDSNLLRIIAPGPSKKASQTLASDLRLMYLASNNFTIYGIDFERPLFYTEAIKYICEKLKITDNELYKYIVAVPDTTLYRLSSNDALWKERRLLFDHCYTLYKTNKKFYDDIVDDSFSISDIFTNPVSETNFGGRDAAMVQNLLPVINSNKDNLLLIIGSYHV